MIPLSRWLTEQEVMPPGDLSAAPSGGSDEDLVVAEDAREDGQDMSREQELEEALHRAEEALRRERLAHAQREQELHEILGAELVTGLKLQMEQCVSNIGRNIEDAISDVLKPFLSAHVDQQAVTTLMNIINAEVMSLDRPLLELRAPAEYQELIGRILSKQGMPAVLSEGRRIEIAFNDHTARFELLASRWREIIAGDCT